MNWSSNYKWARKYIDINKRGPAPQDFEDFIEVGDFIYLEEIDDLLFLDQMPLAESALISSDPNSGAIRAYVGAQTLIKVILIEFVCHILNLVQVLSPLFILQA